MNSATLKKVKGNVRQKMKNFTYQEQANGDKSKKRTSKKAITKDGEPTAQKIPVPQKKNNMG